jgi:hypothetical protein
MNAEERSRRIESYGQAYPLLVESLREFPREMWDYKPGPDRWSIREILIHLADSEANGYVRCRRLVAEPGLAVLGYDGDAWARELHYKEQSPEEALELFRLLRAASYRLIRDLPDAVWSHTVDHSEYGTYGFERWLEIYERHIPGHIEQMRKNYQAWKSQAASAAG